MFTPPGCNDIEMRKFEFFGNDSVPLRKIWFKTERTNNNQFDKNKR